MHFRRLKRPINEAIRTTVRTIESYRNRCLEVQTSSIDGSAMTLAIFIDGKQCLKKAVTSTNEAKVLARGMNFAMDLVDAMDAERDAETREATPAMFRPDGDLPIGARPTA